MGPQLLERDVYGVSEAALLLGLHTPTVKRWLDGYERGPRAYPPVVRIEPTGSDIVTLGEFVELGYLREYRQKDVPLQKLRPVVDRLRTEFGVRYPLAHFKPFVDGRELLLELQRETELDPRLYIVITKGHQLRLAPPAEAFLQKVEFEDDVAGRLRPEGRGSPVVIDPQLSFGAPQVNGVPTEAIIELFRAGEGIEHIARGYELAEDDVEAAIRFELKTSIPAA